MTVARPMSRVALPMALMAFLSACCTTEYTTVEVPYQATEQYQETQPRTYTEKKDKLVPDATDLVVVFAKVNTSGNDLDRESILEQVLAGFNQYISQKNSLLRKLTLYKRTKFLNEMLAKNITKLDINTNELVWIKRYADPSINLFCEFSTSSASDSKTIQTWITVNYYGSAASPFEAMNAYTGTTWTSIGYQFAQSLCESRAQTVTRQETVTKTRTVTKYRSEKQPYTDCTYTYYALGLGALLLLAYAVSNP